MTLALFRSTSGALRPLLTGLVFGGLAMMAMLESAAAQSPQPRDQQVCGRLEAQLSALSRGTDTASNDQTRGLEDSIARQQSELDRAVAQSRQLGCDRPGIFQLFNPQSQQCGPMSRQIEDMRTSLNRMMTDLQRLQGSSVNYERDNQRRAILAALAQNECGPQYRQAAAPAPERSFFERLFGGGGVDESNSNLIATPGAIFEPQSGSGFRTVCVRTCDGSFFPISFSTSFEHFANDERACQRMCPATEVMLFAYRNPGEDISHAVSISGQPYTALPNAFAFKREYNPACSCRRPGESWADALKHLDDRQTVLERGDIIVTEERAKQLSAPRDAKGRPVTPANANSANANSASANAAAPAAASPAASGATESGQKPVRQVGPQFLPNTGR